MKYKFLFSILTSILFTLHGYCQSLQPIPDPNFRNYLKSNMPQCFEGELLNISCDALSNSVLSINVANLGISDLTGLQYFKRVFYIDCSNNKLTSLEGVLPDSVTVLYCQNNQLTSLPVLPDSLHWFDCSGNLLTSLPTLPEKLDFLRCARNQLTQLPVIPPTCEIIRADFNSLTLLPTLPNSLRNLTVNYNLLTELPSLPSKLEILFASYNQLTEIPALPSTLRGFQVSNNELTVLPDLPSEIDLLNCSNNPISCLPFLPWKLKTLYFYGTSVSCLPNMPLLLEKFRGTTTVICTEENIKNNCSYLLPSVKGTVFIDTNGNRIQDEGEPGVANVFIKNSYDENPKTYTDSLGNFALYLSPGTYTYRPEVPSMLYTIWPTGKAVTITEGQANSVQANFALTPTKVVNDLTVSVTGLSRFIPGFATSYTITCTNSGNQPISLADLTFKYPSALTFEHTSESYISHSDIMLKWALPVLNPGQKKNYIVYFTMPATVSLGSVLSSVAILKPFNSPDDTTRNYYTLARTVVGSFDPNDKSVFPESMSPEQAEDGVELEYIIRFQNTGTHMAYTVVLLDTLSNLLDPSTLKMISSSHKYNYVQQGKVASWTFENIKLQDIQSNEPESHGFIKFTIKSLPGIEVGEIIENNAGIVFDFNEAVITNTTETPVENLITTIASSRESSIGVELYPNPCSSYFSLSFEAPANFSNAYFILRNNLSQEVERRSFTAMKGENTLEFDTKNLNSGIYYLEMFCDGTRYGAKLVKR